MLYYLHRWSDDFGLLNVFQYQTFRAAAAGLTAFLLCLAFGGWVIRRLISLKLGQPIRTQEEVNRLAELHGPKAGTPTMGGVLLLGAVLLSTFLWARPDNPFVWLAVAATLVLGGLGFADDYLKVTRKKSDGLPGRAKLVGQFALAAGLTAFFFFNPHLRETAAALYVPFFKEPLIANMGLATLLFYALIIMGSSNAVNLTDGLDGLASGCTVTVAFAFAVFCYAAGNVRVSDYLQIPAFWVPSVDPAGVAVRMPLSGELTVVCMALVGAGLGFLWFNCHPAKVFMGDTGSLAIGGLIGVVAICCKQEMLLVIVGGVFVAEAVSVILQVLSFKLTGRRIFRMAPLHHHFELKGWKENTVVVRFWILSIMCALFGLATLKLR